MPLPPDFELILLHLATTISRLESETLHIPPSLRFFRPNAPPEELCRHAIYFAIAVLHGFFTMPVLDKLAGRGRETHVLVRSVGWFTLYLFLFWSSLVLSHWYLRHFDLGSGSVLLSMGLVDAFLLLLVFTSSGFTRDYHKNK